MEEDQLKIIPLEDLNFISYRDPRLIETLDDFDSSILWLLKSNHDRRLIDEAIISVIASLDKPNSPSQTAKMHYYKKIKGISSEDESKFRKQYIRYRANRPQKSSRKIFDSTKRKYWRYKQ